MGDQMYMQEHFGICLGHTHSVELGKGEEIKSKVKFNRTAQSYSKCFPSIMACSTGRST